MGATGIQVIQTIADEVAHLTVFTRTTQYVLPMKSPAYGPEEQAAYKSRFDELKATIPHTFTYGFGTHRVPLERNYLEVYHRERRAGRRARQPDRPDRPRGDRAGRRHRPTSWT